MVSTIKLPIPKKGEYTLWSMRMEQYLINTDYSLWQVMLNGDGPIQVTKDENSVETESLWLLSRRVICMSNIEFKRSDERFEATNMKKLFCNEHRGLDKAYDRSKDGIDDLDIDDLYNNLKVFKADIKGSSGSSSNSQNVAFLSTEDTSSSNEVNTCKT
ncbi:hypothetical protein Tco_1378999 [Tanacetum coccineum]